MGYCKKDVTPLLLHWSYVFLALTHRYVVWHCELFNVLWLCLHCEFIVMKVDHDVMVGPCYKGTTYKDHMEHRTAQKSFFDLFQTLNCLSPHIDQFTVTVSLQSWDWLIVYWESLLDYSNCCGNALGQNSAQVLMTILDCCWLPTQGSVHMNYDGIPWHIFPHCQWSVRRSSKSGGQ